MNQAMDTLIGQLVNEVDTSDTVVIFMGDNGNDKNRSLYWGARAQKTCYQGGVHVPCMVYRSGPQIVWKPTHHARRADSCGGRV